MSSASEIVEHDAGVEPTQPAQRVDIDALLVRSVTRWALSVSGLILLYDALILGGYPFPSFIDAARGVAYSLFGVALLVAVLVISFLAYRMITLRVVRSRRTIWLLLLPAVVLLASIGCFLLLSAPK